MALEIIILILLLGAGYEVLYARQLYLGRMPYPARSCLRWISASFRERCTISARLC